MAGDAPDVELAGTYKFIIAVTGLTVELIESRIWSQFAGTATS
jgi:hypothetical protein